MTPEEQAAYDKAEQERLAAENANKDKADKTDDTDTDWVDKKEVMIPKARFDQVNDAKKAAEARLKEFEDAEAKRAEEKALEDGKFQELLTKEKEKNKELLVYKEKYEKLDQSFDEQAQKELDELKTSLGEEKFGEFAKVVSLDNLSGSEKLEKIKASKWLFAVKDKPANPWLPWSGDGKEQMKARYLELAQKANRSPAEKQEFEKLIKSLELL